MDPSIISDYEFDDYEECEYNTLREAKIRAMIIEDMDDLDIANENSCDEIGSYLHFILPQHPPSRQIRDLRRWVRLNSAVIVFWADWELTHPECMMTEEDAHVAVGTPTGCRKFIDLPDRLQTPDVFRTALHVYTQVCECEYDVFEIPPHLYDFPDICHAIVRAYPCHFPYLPDNIRRNGELAAELYLLANSELDVFAHIPDSIFDTKRSAALFVDESSRYFSLLDQSDPWVCDSVQDFRAEFQQVYDNLLMLDA